MKKESSKSPPRPALGRGLSALISAPAVPVASSAIASRGSNEPVQFVPASARANVLETPVGRGEASHLNSGSNTAVEQSLQENSDGSQKARHLELAPTSARQTQPATSALNSVSYAPTNTLQRNPKQPRQDFSDAELAELAESIKTVGLLQPILVRPIATRDATTNNPSKTFEIVAGERRWRAATNAGLAEVPVIIRSLTDQETLEIGLIENIQRENLNPVELALAYQSLMQEFGLNQAQVAERVGKDRASVANYLRLLKLPQEVLSLIRSGDLSMGHAKAILSVREPGAQISLARKAVKETLSVRALESLVARVVVLDTGRRAKDGDGRSGSLKQPERASFPEITDRLRNGLGTKVSIRHGKSGGGRIEIEYFSEEELDRLVDHLCRSQASF